jgi:hypothetical protein
MTSFPYVCLFIRLFVCVVASAADVVVVPEYNIIVVCVHYVLC